MRVKDVMTAKVIGVSESATLWEALDSMTSSKLSALVVFDKSGSPVGLLSEGDMLRRGELGTQKSRPGWLEFLLGGGRVAKDYAHTHGRHVGEIMTRGVISVEPEAELSDAVDQMLARKIKRLVVVTGGRAVGILSRSDVLKALMHALPAPPPASTAARPDVEIEADVIANIDSQHWAPSGSIRVSVAAGVVTLEGAISDDQLRGGLKVIAENTPGVKKVRDRLAWIEPNSGFLVPVTEEPED